MNEVHISLGQINNTCFVVMPFSPLYQTQYEKVIKPAIEESKIQCVRGDEIYSKQRIVDDIWDSIKKCRFIIAELTGRNPNVLYEVGLAHAIGKPVIIITRNGDDVPFDLKDLRYLYYDTNDPHWGENLKIALKKLIDKVLESQTLDRYLEGITVNIKKAAVKSAKKAASGKSSTIAGQWVGHFMLNGRHDISLQLIQSENDLSGTAEIRFDYETEKSIIQQTMTGQISDNEITLSGVNYTFLERGNSEEYMLDTFILTYDTLNDKLNGYVYDEEKTKKPSKFELNRIQ